MMLYSLKHVLTVQAELGLGLCDQPLRTTRELIKANPNGEGAIKAYVLRAKAQP